MPFPSIDPYLDLSFPDAATLPIGKWIIYHLASKRKVAEITYNDYGNYIEVFLYNEGKLLQHFTLPPCDKKKRLIYNVDGSFNREECVDYKVEFGNK